MSRFDKLRRVGRDWVRSKPVQRVLAAAGEGAEPEKRAPRQRMGIRGKNAHREEDPERGLVGGAVLATKAVVDYDGGSRMAVLSCGHRKRYRYLRPPYFMRCVECEAAERALIVEQMRKRPRKQWRKDEPEQAVQVFRGQKPRGGSDGSK